MITAGSDHKVAAGLRRRGERGSITDMNRSSAADSGKSLDDQMARSHDPAMDAQTEITLLYRIDPTRNMARFYRLSIQPTLFGSSSLVRNCCRIGTRGRQMIEFYDKPEEAAAASRHMVLRKLNDRFAGSGVGDVAHLLVEIAYCELPHNLAPSSISIISRFARKQRSRAVSFEFPDIDAQSTGLVAKVVGNAGTGEDDDA
jgi:predicted DNA-binding WGR domain protein